MIENSTFKAPWWLANKHLQTLYPSLIRHVKTPPIHRERLTTPDHDFIDIDQCGENPQTLVILVHGLTGSTQSSYIKGFQLSLHQQGIRSVALNFRGCSGELNQLARAYHSGDTNDLHLLYTTLRNREPNVTIAVIGFSLGANVLLKWLGEQGDKLNLKAAIAISTPMLLAECANKLDTGFSRLYRYLLIKHLVTFMKNKATHLEYLGHTHEAEKIHQLGNFDHIQSFWQYDDQIVAPLHGFHDVHDYYDRSSSQQYLKHITIPTLIIQSQDDPFMTDAIMPSQHHLSPNTTLEITQTGGHVGFVTGNNPFQPIYWLEQRVREFFIEQGVF